MTPLERLHGRFMRAPDHGEGGGEGGGDGGEGSDTGAGAGEQGGAQGGEGEASKEGMEAGDGSLMSGIGAKEGDGAEGGKEGEAKEGEGEGEKKEAVETVVPEAYELAMPEGFELDATLMSEATPVFKDLKLDNEGANKLVPLVTKLTETITNRQNDAFQAMAADWAKESQAAPDIGGTKWAETEGNVARAFDVAASKLPPIPVMKDGKPLVENGKPVMMSGKDQVQGFRDLLGNSKLGNHPTMIRMFNFFGAQVGEDPSFVRPDGGAHVEKSREEIWYPSMTEKKD